MADLFFCVMLTCFPDNKRRQNNGKVDNEMVGHFKQKFRCSLLHLVLVC